ncbi:hypothetical protein M9H77_02617 [Catharanthus roseus]|uniref:Uncharacterized protein n=1 Tax=Catharanthus roseus TaxID=4058 RepID=A0ACC0C915_CATRO|nr:hypothetical protein M9H77_02617 [Catharanthus roseus]
MAEDLTYTCGRSSARERIAAFVCILLLFPSLPALLLDIVSSLMKSIKNGSDWFTLSIAVILGERYTCCCYQAFSDSGIEDERFENDQLSYVFHRLLLVLWPFQIELEQNVCYLKTLDLLLLFLRFCVLFSCLHEGRLVAKVGILYELLPSHKGLNLVLLVNLPVSQYAAFISPLFSLSHMLLQPFLIFTLLLQHQSHYANSSSSSLLCRIQFWTFLFALAFAAFLESSICFSLFSEDDSGVDVSEMLQVNVLLQRRLLMSKFSVSNVLQAFLYFHLHPLDCVFYFVPSSYSLFLAVRFVKSETMEAL